MDRLGISGGTLVIQDQETNEETVYKGLDLAFDKQHGVTRFRPVGGGSQPPLENLGHGKRGAGAASVISR